MRGSRMLSRACCLILAGAVSFVSTGQGRAQQKASDEPVLQSLLNEVRLLRQALQRASLNGYRSQIIVERMRAQQDRISRLTRALEGARDELANIQHESARLAEQAKLVESAAQQESEAGRRAQLETEFKTMKGLLESHRAREEQMREREGQLLTTLRVEQARLDELDSRLDALEREIERELDEQKGGKPKDTAKRP